MIKVHSKLFESDGEHVTPPQTPWLLLYAGILSGSFFVTTATVQHQEIRTHHCEKQVLLLHFSFKFYSNMTEIIRFNIQYILRSVISNRNNVYGKNINNKKQAQRSLLMLPDGLLTRW